MNSAATASAGLIPWTLNSSEYCKMFAITSITGFTSTLHAAAKNITGMFKAPKTASTYKPVLQISAWNSYHRTWCSNTLKKNTRINTASVHIQHLHISIPGKKKRDGKLSKKSYLHQRGLTRGYLTLREAARYHDVPVSRIEVAVTHRDIRHPLQTCGSLSKVRFNKSFVEWNQW
jgi:hypothetical protein